ncbi:MAG: tRNA (adenosine(37)-N6)-dimethylallyltransferase [Candidatus Actinomarinaceae bacterium]
MLYFLTGLTASGKSSVAHEIAIERNIPILSLDSMAVYKGLDILSAKPTDVMRAQVEYFGLDIAEPDQNFSIVDYLNYLLEIDFANLTYTKDILAVGGTGLYFSSLVKNYEFRPTDPTIRAELEQLNYGQLLKFHEIYKIELPNVELNKRRLIRNIESSLLEDAKYVFPTINIPSNKVGVFWNNPDYKQNIQNRTNHMIQNGLNDELNSLLNPSKTIMQAIGMNIDSDIESNINQKTFKLAKKQLTWFKKEDSLEIYTTKDREFIKNKMIELMDE